MLKDYEHCAFSGCQSRMLTSRHDVPWESPYNGYVQILSLAGGAGGGFIPFIKIETKIGSRNLDLRKKQSQG